MSVPKRRCFVDSNVWIYAFTQSQDTPPDLRHETARQKIAQVQPCLSTQVINEVTVNLRRKFSFNEVEVRSLIQSFYRNYTVFSLDADTLIQASILRESYLFSFWDSLIVSSALQQDCELVYSEDMQHGLFINSRLEICNPFAS
jgi:predicted nucleic acid-binding protein